MQRCKNIIEFLENTKTVVTTIVTIVILVFGLNAQKIAQHFPFVASILNIEVEDKTQQPVQNIQQSPDQLKDEVKKELQEDFKKYYDQLRQPAPTTDQNIQLNPPSDLDRNLQDLQRHYDQLQQR